MSARVIFAERTAEDARLRPIVGDKRIRVCNGYTDEHTVVASLLHRTDGLPDGVTVTSPPHGLAGFLCIEAWRGDVETDATYTYIPARAMSSSAARTQSARLALEMSQGDFAALLGVSDRTVRRWEAGGTTLSNYDHTRLSMAARGFALMDDAQREGAATLHPAARLAAYIVWAVAHG